jgi:hypothetical protein
MPVSWQNRYLPAGGRDVVSLLVRWGGGSSLYLPSLSMSLLSTPSSTTFEFSFSGRIETNYGDAVIHIPAEVDSDPSRLFDVNETGYHPGDLSLMLTSGNSTLPTETTLFLFTP